MKKQVLIFVVCFYLPLFVGAKPTSFSKITPLSIKSFKNILEIKNIQAQVIPFGDSFIYQGKLKKKSNFVVPQNLLIKKAVLVWMGEGVSEAAHFSLKLKNPQGKSFSIKPEKKIQNQGVRFVYSCWADVTREVKETGRYEISSLQSHKVPTPLQAAGWSLLLVVKDKEAPRGDIIIKWGFHRLQPGELYNFKIMEGMKNSFVHSVVIIGAHGQKENGSGNSLNGVTLSMGDDWNGSSGESWDVDQYDVGFFKYSAEKGITITVDPLLQWLFPTAFVVHTEAKK